MLLRQLQQHETNDNSKVVRIGRILAIMYENESFGRAAIQSEEAEILTKYIIKNDSLALEIDSLKILTNSPYQVVLVDSIKLLLEEKLQNIFELKSIREASESDSILDEGIKNFINIESSMGKLTLEDFSSNPENLAKKQKETLEEIITILNKYRPRDTSVMVDEQTLDSIIVQSKTHLKQVRNEIVKQRKELVKKENQLVQNDLTVSQQIKTLLSLLESDLRLSDLKLAKERDKALQRGAYILILAAVIATLLVIIFSLLILNDFWKAQRYRKELENANSYTSSLLQSREQLISMVSHDLRTPLSTIVGYANMLQSHLKEQKQKYYLSSILESSSYMSQLVDDLLDYSKLEAGKLTISNIPFDISTLLNDIVSNLKNTNQEKDISLSLNIDNTLSTSLYIGDPYRIRQIITNLLGNAYKFTSKGEIVVHAYQKDSKISIAISDTGVGIPEKALSTIFVEFTQANSTIERQYGGYGMGLTISKKLATLMDGHISVKSELNKGSIFTLTLPATLKEKPKHDPSKTIKNLTAILIDDDINLLQLLEETLQQRQIFTHKFSDAETALEALKKIKFDFILTDIQLPKINGFRFLNLLVQQSEFNTSIPVFAMTGRKDINRELYLSSGFTQVLYKPFTPQELFNTISHYFPLQNHPITDKLPILTEKKLSFLTRLNHFVCWR